MRIHVVGTLRNKLNIKAIIGYFVYDMESKELRIMHTKELKQALLEKEVEFSNIELSENSMYGTIVGKRYNLDILTYVQDGENTCSILDQYTVFEKYADNTYLVGKFDGKDIDFKVHTLDEMLVIQDSIWNYSDKSATMFDCVDEASGIDSNNNSLSINEADEVKQLQDRREQLLKEAYDKNVVWSLKEFKEFMQLMGWSYELESTSEKIPEKLQDEAKGSVRLYKLNNVSNDCEVLHLPIEIVESDSLFKSKPLNLHTLIINYTLRELHTLYFMQFYNKENKSFRAISNGMVANMKCGLSYGDFGGKIPELDYDEQRIVRNMDIEPVNIHNVYRQRASEEWEYYFYSVCNKFGGLSALNIDGDIDFNNKSSSYKYLLNLTTFNNIHGLECRLLVDSFIKIESKDSSLNINIQDTQGSFKYVKMQDNFSISFGEYTRKLVQSFNNMNLAVLDFSQTKEIQRLDMCFNSLEGLEVFDISHIEELLRSMSNSLQHCKKLHTVKLCKSIDILGHSNIYGSELVERVEIPEDTNVIYGSCFQNGKCEVIYPKKVTVLSNNFMRAFTTAANYTPIFQAVITKLDTTLQGARGSLEDLKLPSTLENLTLECFKDSNLTDYDSTLLPNIKHIPNRTFYCSAIRNVIFADNIETIGEDALAECHNLQSVILGKNIREMPSSLFKGCNPSNIIKVYIVKGSYAQKRLRKSNKVILIEVDSTEEAIQKERGNLTPEKKQSAFEILLRDTEYKSLLDPRCINGISFLYPLYQSLKNDEPYMQEEVQLDTSKFKSLSLDMMPGIQKVVTELRAEAPKNDKNQYKRFVALSNLITSLSNNFDRFFEERTIDKLNRDPDITYNRYNTWNRSYLYLDKDNAIILIQLNDKEKAHIICIIQNNTIVYVTSYWNSEYARILQNGKHSLFKKPNSARIMKYSNIGLGTMIMPGDRFADRYSSDMLCCFHSLSTPNDLIGEIISNINDTCSVIGIPDFEKKSKQRKREGLTYNVLLYESLNARFIECLAEVTHTDKDRTQLESLRINSILGVYTLGQINQINQEYFKWLYNGFNSMELVNKLNNILISSEELNDIRSDISNYDLDGDMNITYTGELIYQNNIQTVDELLNNKPLLQRVLDSHLYEKVNMSLNYLKKYSEIYKSTIIKPLNNSHSIFLEYKAVDKNDNSIFISGLVDGNTTMSSKKFLIGSMMDLQHTINMLYSIGKTRSEFTGNHKPGIDNNKTDASKYYFLMTQSLNNFNRHGVKIHLAIDLYNADTYIIGDIWDMDFYKIFRVKRFSLGVQLFRILVYGSKDSSSMQHTILDILDDILSGYYERESNGLQALRNKILRGLPNNVPYTGSYPGIADILAKQPSF